MAQRPATKLIRSSVDSASRLVDERGSVAQAVDTSLLKRHFNNVAKPPSLSGGLRKAGIALIAAPDPFTSVPGVALLASSFVRKKKEPAGLESLALEARKVLREIQSSF